MAGEVKSPDEEAREIVTFHRLPDDDGTSFEVHIGSGAFSKGRDEDEMAHVYRATVREVSAALRAREVAALEKAAAEIPTTWLDPLLTGPGATLPTGYVFGPQDVQKLLTALKARIRALAVPGKEAKRG